MPATNDSAKPLLGACAVVESMDGEEECSRSGYNSQDVEGVTLAEQLVQATLGGSAARHLGF